MSDLPLGPPPSWVFPVFRPKRGVRRNPPGGWPEPHRVSSSLSWGEAKATATRMVMNRRPKPDRNPVPRIDLFPRCARLARRFGVVRDEVYWRVDTAWGILRHGRYEGGY